MFSKCALALRIAAAYALLLVATSILLWLGFADGSRGWARGLSPLDIGVVVVAVALLAAIEFALRLAAMVTAPLEQVQHSIEGVAAGEVLQLPHEAGRVDASGLFAAVDDMVQRVNTKLSALERERSRLEELLAASADALVAVDSDAVIRYLNPAAVRLFGKAVRKPFIEAARNHELSALLRASLPVAEAGAANARHGRPAAPIYLDMNDTWVQASVNPLGDDANWAALVVLHDITSVRRSDAVRRDFVANVSHELRTPLAGIKAVVETLRDGAMHDPVAADEFLERVDSEVDRLVQLVEELLQLARIESGTALSLTEVEPEMLLVGCIERFSHQAERVGIALQLEVPTDLPAIRADPDRLDQAVGNLIHNAVKFTPAGGRVTVSAAIVDGQLDITVTDTGIGIDPADLPRVFERFYIADRARSKHGTGLGLAIVKHVALAHGGTVDAKSTLGRGSTFTISLPLAAAS
jgi:two-component system, OmpR family, phosphate regulon sensor histidine kinase PhoR